MGAAFGALGLNSHDLWAMTPRELGAAMRFIEGRGTGGSGVAPSRQDLQQMMQQFPDKGDGR